MAPQTRSATKFSPGRSTRNSVYGRPQPSPPKPRKSTNNSSARAPQAHDTETTPWLACRDAYGVLTSIAVSETGEGIHIRWYHPGDDCERDEDEEADVLMIIDEDRGVTPLATAGPSDAAGNPFPQTPMTLQPFDAGSVIRTPVKKAKPLQPSPPRIGDKGVRCLYEKDGVLRELNGGVRAVLRHPIGSSTNLTREQVEQLEDERGDTIVRVQVKRLLEQKQRLLEEEAQFSDSGCEEEMETDAPPPSLEEIVRGFGFHRGPNGELLDQDGRQMLGQEGTILMDPTCGSPRRIRREEAFLLSTKSIGKARARFGPEGTQLID